MNNNTLSDFLGREITHGTFFVRTKKLGNGYKLELGVAVLDPVKNKMVYVSAKKYSRGIEHDAMKIPYGESCVIVDRDEVQPDLIESVKVYIGNKYATKID